MHANLVTFSQFSAALYVHRGISTFGAFIIIVLSQMSVLNSSSNICSVSVIIILLMLNVKMIELMIEVLMQE